MLAGLSEIKSILQHRSHSSFTSKLWRQIERLKINIRQHRSWSRWFFAHFQLSWPKNHAPPRSIATTTVLVVCDWPCFHLDGSTAEMRHGWSTGSDNLHDHRLTVTANADLWTWNARKCKEFQTYLCWKKPVL